MVKQAKPCSFREAKRYKYGVEIPKNYEDAVHLPHVNNNTLWKEAMDKELFQIDDYSIFSDNGKDVPAGYHKICVHFIFDVKHNGRRKPHLVADGHLTEVPLESIYLGVISLRGLHLIIFLAELNQLELCATDIGNAYLKAETKEKLYIITGPEFGDQQGHVLIIHKSLYALDFIGTNDLPIASAAWVSFLARENPISGCNVLTATMRTLLCTLMIWPLHPRIPSHY